jgi:hypothetical protein
MVPKKYTEGKTSDHEDYSFDSTIKDLTGVTYAMKSYSEHETPVTTYVESQSVAKSGYSKPKEIDSKTYPSLIPPV